MNQNTKIFNEYRRVTSRSINESQQGEIASGVV